MKLVATGKAEEIMTTPIIWRAKAAARAIPACASGKDFQDIEGTIIGLIAEEGFPLIERPTIQIRSLLFPQPVVTDAIEPLDSDCGIACKLCELDDPAGNNVVYITPKTSFSATQQFQTSADASRVFMCLLALSKFALHGSPSLGIVPTDCFGMSSTKESGGLTIGGYRDIVDTSVNPNHGIIGLMSLGNFMFERDRDINLVLGHKQSCIPQLPVSNVLRQPGCTMKRQALHTSLESPNAQTGFQEREVSASFAALKHHSVIPEMHRLLRKTFQLLQCGIFARHLADSVLCYLRGQTKAAAYLVIGQRVQKYRIRNLAVIKRYLTDVVTGVSPGLHRLFSQLRGKTYLDFSGSDNFHYRSNLNTILSECQEKEVGADSSAS